MGKNGKLLFDVALRIKHTEVRYDKFTFAEPAFESHVNVTEYIEQFHRTF